MKFNLINIFTCWVVGRLWSTFKVILSGSIVLSIVGCSQLSQYSKPADWFETGRSKLAGVVNNVINLSMTEDSPEYPKLSSVPPKPGNISTSGELWAIRYKLIADRANARYIKGKSNLWPNSLPPKTKKTNSFVKQVRSAGYSSLGVKKKEALLESKEKPNDKKTNKLNSLVVSKVGQDEIRLKNAKKNIASVSPKAFRFNIPSSAPPKAELVTEDFKFKSVDIMTFDENKAILFEHGSARLSRSDIEFIKKMSIKAIETNSIVRVTGHASMRTRDMDAFKHALANFNISLKRANAVAQALMKNRISAENLIIDAVGASDPVGSESMPSGERANRRAEISLETS